MREVIMPKILVLYENHTTGVSLLEVLAQEGFEAVGLDSVDTIWEQLETTQPDLVLLDSGTDGFDAKKLYFDIRQKYADLPSIIYKAAGDDVMDRIKGAVADALAKPNLRSSGSTFRVEKNGTLVKKSLFNFAGIGYFISQFC
jgi:DNA-binding response OmpR family regulator